MFGRVMNTSLNILAFRLKYFPVECAFNDSDTVKGKKKMNEQKLHAYYKYQLLV